MPSGTRRRTWSSRAPIGRDRSASAATRTTIPRASSMSRVRVNATPHVAQNANGRCSAIDGRTTRHAGYAVSQRIRKRIEEAFGWIKMVAGPGANQTPRPRAGRMGLHLRRRRLQSCSAAEAPGGLAREGPGELQTDRPLADRRGRPLGPRSPRSERPGDADDHRARRRNRLRRLGGRPGSRMCPNSIGFHWAGCEEGDEVEGEGTAELLDDGTIEIEFAYRNGDEALLKAKWDTSSTAC